MLFTIILYNIFNNSINNNEVTTFVVVDRERGQVVVLGLNLSATNLQEIRKIITKERGGYSQSRLPITLYLRAGIKAIGLVFVVFLFGVYVLLDIRYFSA